MEPLVFLIGQRGFTYVFFSLFSLTRYLLLPIITYFFVEGKTYSNNNNKNYKKDNNNKNNNERHRLYLLIRLL